jgi:uncharacterized protein (TIGR03084 family)
MTMLDDLLDDLTAETDRLREAVAPLDDAGWHAPTPAEGWDVATQIAHLAWTDEAAVLAARAARGDKDEWDALVLGALADPDGYVDKAASAGAQVLPEDLLARWDASRAALVDALRAADGKLPWFGPPMSPASMATARFMETWAHGLDVFEALGAVPEPTDRIRHVCHLGIRTRDWVFRNHGLEAPAAEFRIELVAPSGAVWSWGPESGAERVSGTAYDFARLVTQRIHRADTSLETVGADADRWLGIAQAFAGPPGAGRQPR